ncbi:MAG TPA: ribose ABC transporter permease [Chthonomonadales bacterium]|nr:ribose ABC transporter permease [Chthonomonadales bacterium]
MNSGVLVGFAALTLILFLTTPQFRTGQNLQNVVQQVSLNAIIAVGMTLVIITGGIDLSVGSILGLAGCATALTLTSAPAISVSANVAIAMAIAAGIATGALVGLLNGVAVTWLKMQPFIVTLATMWAVRGAAEVITNGSPVGIVSGGHAAAHNSLLDRFTFLGMGYTGIGPLKAPVSSIAAIVTVAIGAVMLDRTSAGRHIRAIGGNEEASRLSAIPVGRVKLLVYSLSGALAGLAAVLLMSKLSSGQPTAGMGYELYAIAAVVVGGTSLRGGAGSVQGSLIGALIIGLIDNGLDLHDVSSFWQQIVTGLIIFVAVLLDEVTRRRRHIA